MLKSSVPGIRATGDARLEAVGQVASAAGQGAIGVSFMHPYLRSG
jgi:thioredoxin reductase